MDARQLIKLNNYDFSLNDIAEIKHYLKTGEPPKEDFEHYYRVKKFKDRYDPSEWEFRGDILFYKPLNWRVIPTEEQEEFLKKIYLDPEIGIGKGIKSLYEKVLEYNVLGISRGRIKQFLEGQSSYQFTKPERKPVNKPIITRYPNERWSADLIDMKSYAGHNGQKKWILTVIDNFSKYVFATPLVNKKSDTVLDGFKKIIEEQAEGTYPQVLHTDNGGEFVNATLEAWAKENKIHLVKSASYQPTSNALVENFNNILRKMIREGNVRNNSLNWIDNLNTYLINRNNTKHSTTKYKPIDLWRKGRQAFNDKNAPPEVLEVKANIEDKARRDLARFKETKLEKGDRVRLSFRSISSKIRDLIEKGDQKYIAVKFSPHIYTISRVLKPRGRDAEFVKTRYTVLDTTGGEKLTEEKANSNKERKVQVFFATDLQKVEEKPNEKHITQKDADKLNKVKTEFNEVKIKEGKDPYAFDDKPKVKEEVISNYGLRNRQTREEEVEEKPKAKPKPKREPEVISNYGLRNRQPKII